MPPLTLEISLSIIYPTTTTPFSDGSVRIDITAPDQAHRGDVVPQHQPPPTILQTGPSHPIYRLPQSLSSGGMKIHLNAYAASGGTPEVMSHRELARSSRTSMIDKDHILYEITKVPVGSDYRLECFRYGKGTGAYGFGLMSFVSGWLSGGVWNVVYKTQASGAKVETSVKIQIDDGGSEHGVWKLIEPVQKVVARERPPREGEYGENGRSIEIFEDDFHGQGIMPGEEWRDFIVACWITKVWREATRKPLFETSVRSSTEAGTLRTW
ncbi:hypothetical protein HOY82DRAFT_589429 [Tuber indicum]|nr:hypothetical protein HOY82DRAFT_589429 [Tuber indicum]